MIKYPVVLFKIVFIQALDGLKSMRQTCKKIKVDAEYRWFLGKPFGKETPHMKSIAIKNDNVDKKPLSSPSILYNFIKLLKKITTLNKKNYS